MRTAFTEIGNDCEWPAATRAQVDALSGPTGPLIGDAKTVAKRILHANEILSGISRTTLQMRVSALPHRRMVSGT
jgi:hypothetical protein